MTAHLIWTLSTLPSAASALQSAISALEREIAALESQSSGLEPWLGWFTLLVAIGVALEIVVVILDHRNEVNEWRVSELIPEGPSLIKLGIEIASIVLVIAGVMGEFGVGVKISSINGQLRAKGAKLRSTSDQLLALATQEAGQANERAATNEKRAEDEALLRAELEKEFVKQEPRFTLLRWRRSYLVGKLRRFSGQRFTTLTESLHTDTEASGAATEIAVMLESDAKWVNNTPHASFGPGNMFGTGVMVRILPNATVETRRAASALFKVLRETLISGVQFADNGQDVQRSLASRVPFNEQTVLIEVGEHPTPLSPPHPSNNTKRSR